MSINRVTISGNLTRDPDLRTTATGNPVLGFSVAVNDRRKNNATGEWEDHPNFVDCTMFGTRAEKITPYLSKGTKVAIDSKLRWSQWEKDGQKRSKIEVIIDEIEFLSRGDHPEVQVSQPTLTRPSNVQTQMPGMPVARPVVDASIYDTDIPF